MRFPILFLCIIQLGQSYFFDLELDLHGSLKRGNQLPYQTGGYLKDSFRLSVLILTFKEIIRKLKEQRRENVLQDLLMGLMFLTLVRGLVYGYVRTNKSRLVKSFKALNQARPLERLEQV